ncbi:MAG: cysteine dioxygenase [Planctomycetota bacterium]|jgi:cysteine dioxygenase
MSTLKAFLDELDGYQQRVPLDLLTQRMRELQLTIDDVRPWLQFGESGYQRNLMHEGPGYQALILCWRAGQRSPIHDHRGSSCGVRVLRGTCTETVFHRDSRGHLMAARTQELSEGGVCGSEDADIHQVSNLQDGGADLVTLHVYSPALLRMGTYSLTSPDVIEFEDPVHEFCQGSGI